MLEKLKEIIIGEIENEKKQIIDQINIKKSEFTRLQAELDELQEKQSYPIVQRSYSFIERYITKRKQYHEYQKKQEEQENLSQKIKDVRENLEKEKARVDKEIEESELLNKYDKLSERLTKVKDVTAFGELGINLHKAIKFLENKGIPVILTEEDKNISINKRDYSSKKSLIGVHKTRFIPEGDTIKTAKDANVREEKTMTINGQKYSYEYMRGRDTIHLAINDEVESHAFGNWDDCKYAILIPMEDISNEQIGVAAPQDTFIKGNLKLTANSWILCPQGEGEVIKKNNSNINVIEYEGKAVQGYARAFLTALGYRAENVGMHSWKDEKSVEDYIELMKNEGLETTPHAMTYFMEDERVLEKINEVVAIYDVINKNNLLQSKEDITNIMEQLECNSCLLNICNPTEFEEKDCPNSIKASHKHMDIFIEKLKEKGIKIPNEYQSIFRGIGNLKKGTNIETISAENIELIFQEQEGRPEDNRKLINQLKQYLENAGVCNMNNLSEIAKFMMTAILESIVESKEQDLLKEEDYEQEI